MMRQKVLNIVLMLFLFSIYSCGGLDGSKESAYKLDSLNMMAFNFRYVNIDSACVYAEQVYAMSEHCGRHRAMALNTMAFTAAVRMDYENAYNLYNRVRSVTKNRIEWLVADVGMMDICQHISDNMAFYEFRSRALITLDNIDGNIEGLSKANMDRLLFARNELRMVSAKYYQELDQTEKAFDELNRVQIDTRYNGYDEHWALYNYLRGTGIKPLIGGIGFEFPHDADFLNWCVTESSLRGYDYTYVLGLAGLSRLIVDKPEYHLPKSVADKVLEALNPLELTVDALSEQLALMALKTAKGYGGKYEVIECYRVLAEVYIASQRYSEAIDTLSKALEELNSNVITYYADMDSLPLLESYRDDGVIVERVWLEWAPFAVVPERMSSIRELMSLAYSGLSNKVLSDYNRDVYLELQKSIRLDRSQEARAAMLKRVNMRLSATLGAVIAVILFTVVFFSVAGRRLRRRDSQRIDVLKRVMALCEKILSALPGSDGISVESTIANAVKEDLEVLTGAVDVVVWSGALNNAPAERNGYVMTVVPLISVNGNSITGGMAVYTHKRLDKDKMTVLETVTPYVWVALENGHMLAGLDERCITAGKEHYLVAAKLEDNKRENLARKACYSVVSDCAPFIDRLVNEISRLKAEKSGTERYNSRLQYIAELTGRINEYNEVLSHWIQTRQGIVSLRIENFRLKPIFDIIGKGARGFAQKGLELNVIGTDAFVKADRALTLFMISTLVDNAGKFTPHGGKVSVLALECKDYVEISVSDTGVGLSEEDIRRIMENKVYDAGLIGTDRGDSTVIQGKSDKGGGFGLMNCKGIIEQYRRSESIFKVCLFGIESKEGSGSRFFFRLPNGVRRGVLGLALVLISGIGGAVAQNSGQVAAIDSVRVAETGDSLLFDAYCYADMAYQYNTLGKHEIALVYADSALCALNSDYLAYGGDSAMLLSLNNNGRIAELKWLENGFETDYETILWLRNEVAVSALVLREWDLYRYNDEAYLRLFKNYFSEKDIERDCMVLQRSNSNISIAIILFVLILMLFLLFRYALFSKRRLRYRNDLEQVLYVLRRISAATILSEAADPESGVTDAEKVAGRIAEGIYPDLYRLLSVRSIVVAVSDGTGLVIKTYSKKGQTENSSLVNKTRECFENGYLEWNPDSLHQALPLVVETAGERLKAGALGLEFYDKCRKTDMLMAGMVARYMAVALYNRVFRVAERYLDIERVRDESERTRFEDNRLRVQNLILDNCLSTLKHETVYYPNRISHIVHELDSNNSDGSGNEVLIQDMFELVTYYRDVFKILSQYAARQLDDSLFKRQRVDVKDLMADAADYFKSTAKKRGNSLSLIIGECDATCAGDRTMLCFLLRNLIDQAYENAVKGEIRINAFSEGNFIRFVFSDNRGLITQESLNMMFSPLWKGPLGVEGQNNQGYVICRCVIREHDEAYGHPGCRINAEAGLDGGISVWFTVPSGAIF